MEYLVVVSLTTAFLVASFSLSISGVRNTVLKKNYMRSLVLDIRTIQNYALAVRPIKAGPGIPANRVGQIPKAYGIYFQRTPAPNRGYILFADMPSSGAPDGDRVYDDNPGDDVVLKTLNDTVPPAGYRTTSIRDSFSASNHNNISITFEPPDATVAFYKLQGGNPDQITGSRATTTIRDPSLQDQFELVVYETGRITVK